jgi:hypothetical protein
MSGVLLEDVVREMEVLADETHAYLNRRTGKLVTLGDEEISIVEEGRDIQAYPEWQQESIQETREVLSSEDYLSLPTKFEIDEYSIVERFCRLVEDPALREELLSQIRGRGAFRRFKDAVHRHGVAEDWYRFRRGALEDIAAEWLEENGIPYRREAG